MCFCGSSKVRLTICGSHANMLADLKGFCNFISWHMFENIPIVTLLAYVKGFLLRCLRFLMLLFASEKINIVGIGSDCLLKVDSGGIGVNIEQWYNYKHSAVLLFDSSECSGLTQCSLFVLVFTFLNIFRASIFVLKDN